MLQGKLPILIAGSLAILSGALIHGSISAKERELREEWNPIAIVVAAKDSSEGEGIEIEMIARGQMPERFVSPSMVRPEHVETILGQKLLVPLREGDPVLWSHFESARESEKLSSKVLKRARAVTISVTETSSVGGWIRPNDHVDVLATFRDPTSQELMTVTLLQNVIVLATGKQAGAAAVSRGRGYNDVSVLVLPEEAEILVLAQEMGSLTLVLRNPDEVDGGGDRGRATAGTLLTGERTRTLEKIRQETIQVIRGNRAGGFPNHGGG